MSEVIAKHTLHRYDYGAGALKSVLIINLHRRSRACIQLQRRPMLSCCLLKPSLQATGELFVVGIEMQMSVSSTVTQITFSSSLCKVSPRYPTSLKSPITNLTACSYPFARRDGEDVAACRRRTGTTSRDTGLSKSCAGKPVPFVCRAAGYPALVT